MGEELLQMLKYLYCRGIIRTFNMSELEVRLIRRRRRQEH